MSYEMTGRLIEKYDTMQVSEKFRKREFVIEKTETVNQFEYVDPVKFQLTQDRCNVLDTIELGETLKVTFNIRGRKWEKDGRVNYFQNLEAWKIERTGVEAPAPPPHKIDDIPMEAADDLPF